MKQADFALTEHKTILNMVRRHPEHLEQKLFDQAVSCRQICLRMESLGESKAIIAEFVKLQWSYVDLALLVSQDMMYMNDIYPCLETQYFILSDLTEAVRDID